MKKLREVGDGSFMKELDMDFKNFESLQQSQKNGVIHEMKSRYNSILLKLLELNVSSIDELSLEQQEKLGLIGSGKDIFITVDENDNVTGVEFRVLCHNGINTVNKIHRASDWIVINEKSEILMAQRASDKDLYPGYWEFGGGHIDDIDTYEETLYRELKDELNIAHNDILKVSPLMKYLQKEAFQQQYLKVFVVIIKNTTNIMSNDGEIVGKKFLGEPEILSNISKILDGGTPEYKMIPHQIFSILKYLQKTGVDTALLLEKFERWMKNNDSLKEFEVQKITMY